jgi:hypothetical protein
LTREFKRLTREFKRLTRQFKCRAGWLKRLTGSPARFDKVGVVWNRLLLGKRTCNPSETRRSASGFRVFRLLCVAVDVLHFNRSKADCMKSGLVLWVFHPCPGREFSDLWLNERAFRLFSDTINPRGLFRDINRLAPG